MIQNVCFILKLLIYIMLFCNFTVNRVLITENTLSNSVYFYFFYNIDSFLVFMLPGNAIMDTEFIVTP